MIIKTVSAIITDGDGRILALKRGFHKKHPGKWNIVSGKFEGRESARQCLKREIEQETGITKYEIVDCRSPLIYDEPDGQSWLVHAFLCRVDGRLIRINEEHTEYRWVTPEEFIKLDCAAPALLDIRSFFVV